MENIFKVEDNSKRENKHNQEEHKQTSLLKAICYLCWDIGTDKGKI